MFSVDISYDQPWFDPHEEPQRKSKLKLCCALSDAIVYPGCNFICRYNPRRSRQNIHYGVKDRFRAPDLFRVPRHTPLD